MNRVVITNPELNYYTRVINNYENVEFDEMLDENEAQLIINNSVVDFAKRTNRGLINLPENRNLALMTDLDMNGKSYANKLLINVSDITTGTELPVLNPQTTSITQNGTYTIADTDNNPEDIEIERVQQRKVLNIVEKSKENLRDSTVNLGTFTVNVPQGDVINNANVNGNGIIVDNGQYSIPSGYTGFNGFNVNIPILENRVAQIQPLKQNYQNPDPETGRVIINKDFVPPENYKGVYKTQTTNYLIPLDVTENGTYLIYEDSNKTPIDIGYWKVNVNVPKGDVINNANVNGNGIIVANGQYSIPSGYTGFNGFNVNVPLMDNLSAQVLTNTEDYSEPDESDGRVAIIKTFNPPSIYTAAKSTTTVNTLLSLNATENKTYYIYNDERKAQMDIGYWKVDVNVPIQSSKFHNFEILDDQYNIDGITDKHVSVNNNYKPDEGYNGVFDTSIRSKLLYKLIDSNGTYDIRNYRTEDRELGWWRVDVNIPMQDTKYVSATIPDDYYINHADQNGNIKYHFEITPNSNYTAMKKSDTELLLLNKTITESGTYTIYENRAQENRLGWWKVDVNIPILQNRVAQIQPLKQNYQNPDPETGRVIINKDFLPPENYKGVYKTQTTNYLIPLDVTENGTYLIYDDSNKTPIDIGYWKVNVNVPKGDVINNANVNGNGIIVANGQYSIPSGYTGFNGFNVNIPIAEDRNIFYDIADSQYDLTHENDSVWLYNTAAVPQNYTAQGNVGIQATCLSKTITSNGVYDIRNDRDANSIVGYWKVNVNVPLMDNLSAQVLTDTSDYLNPDESDGRVSIIKTFNPPNIYTAAKSATTVNTLLSLNATDNGTYYIYEDETKEGMDIGYWKVDVNIPMLDKFNYSIVTQQEDYVYGGIPDDERERVQIKRYIKPPELNKAFKEVDTTNYLMTLNVDHNGTFNIYSDANKTPMDIGYWRVRVNVPENRNVKTIITKPQINNIYLNGIEYEVNEKDYERIEGIKIINNCVNSLISVFKYNSKGKWEINMYYIDENVNNVFIGEENCVSYYNIYETKQKLENINYAILRNDKEEILYNPLILDINSNIYNNPYPTIIGESIELPFNLLL